MLRRACQLVAILAICLLVRSTSASAKKPVERPIRTMASVTVVVDLVLGTYETVEVGECTHFGRFTNRGWGVLAPDGSGPASGAGVITTANGDQVFWTNAPGGAEITGGTGRFEFATGYMLAGPAQDYEMVPGDPGTMIVTYSYVGFGRITY